MHDLRFALRALRATPVVTAVAILSLALGIGANTAIFSIVDVLVLRMLPAADPQRLAILAGSRMSGARPNFSYATFDQIRRYGQAFDGALAFGDCCDLASMTIGGEDAPVDRFFVSGDFFETLGVAALAGRMLEPADDVPGGGAAGPTAVISYRLWQERFGGVARGDRREGHARPAADHDRRHHAAGVPGRGGRAAIRRHHADQDRADRAARASRSTTASPG